MNANLFSLALVVIGLTMVVFTWFLPIWFGIIGFIVVIVGSVLFMFNRIKTE